MGRETGILALFATPHAVKEAVCRVREAGFTQIDAFTPFPVHGLEKALGLKRSWISKVTLIMGLSGAGLLYFFQVWTSAVDWPLVVGGKPMVSWPAFIPITFEGMVLIGGVSTVVALLVACRLPRYRQRPLDPRLTDDRFGVFVEATDPQFDVQRLMELFRACHAEETQHIR